MCPLLGRARCHVKLWLTGCRGELTPLSEHCYIKLLTFYSDWLFLCIFLFLKRMVMRSGTRPCFARADFKFQIFWGGEVPGDFSETMPCHFSLKISGLYHPGQKCNFSCCNPPCYFKRQTACYSQLEVMLHTVFLTSNLCPSQGQNIRDISKHLITLFLVKSLFWR